MMLLQNVRLPLSYKAKAQRVILGLFALGLIAGSTHSTIFYKENLRQLISPPQMVHHMAFGYHETMADLLWIRTLQDLDYCEQQVANKVCKNNSWLYLMLDGVTNLAPKFRMAYVVGALALSVMITDIDGAAKLFEKGIKAFPKDGPILYRAAYHYLYEVKDKKRAAELLIRAGENGAPAWVYSLAGRLYSESGNLELAEALLHEMIQSEQDPAIIKRLQDKINSIKK